MIYVGAVANIYGELWVIYVGVVGDICRELWVVYVGNMDHCWVLMGNVVVSLQPAA